MSFCGGLLLLLLLLFRSDDGFFRQACFAIAAEERTAGIKLS